MSLLLTLLGWPLKLIGRAIAAIWRWASADPLRIVLLAMAALSIVLGHGWGKAAAERDVWSARAVASAASAAQWKSARDQLVADIAAQRARAAVEDRANAARVAAEFDTIRERTADDYQARLDDTRLALERVRRNLAQAAAVDRGDGGSPAVPPALAARCQAIGAADCDALLAALPGQLAAAEDNTAKLISLQDYVRAALAVDYSGVQAEAVAP